MNTELRDMLLVCADRAEELGEDVARDVLRRLAAMPGDITLTRFGRLLEHLDQLRQLEEARWIVWPVRYTLDRAPPPTSDSSPWNSEAWSRRLVELLDESIPSAGRLGDRVPQPGRGGGGE